MMEIESRDPEVGEEMYDIREEVEYHEALDAAQRAGQPGFTLEQFRLEMTRRHAHASSIVHHERCEHGACMAGCPVMSAYRAGVKLTRVGPREFTIDAPADDDNLPF